jgi:hypothetical protein
MALLATGERTSAARGLRWLRSTQRRDGGWAPQPTIDQSNWTTGLVALLPPEDLGPTLHKAAISWLMGGMGQESSLQYRLRQWLLGNHPPDEFNFAGWPWTPGAAAWVGPTAVAIIALAREDRRRPLVGIRERAEMGRRFLLLRACKDGGWNHGAPRPLGYESKAYPETTGMALTALRGVNAAEVKRGFQIALQFLGECHSADAQNWLRLGLLAHGELPRDYCRPARLACRTVAETSLDLLLTEPGAGERFFWC